MSETIREVVPVSANGLALPGRLTATSYELPEDLSLERWLSIGEAFHQMAGSCMWWLGDWWRFGKRQYGDMATQAAKDGLRDLTGYAYMTVMQAAWVAERFQSFTRVKDLPWSYHRAVVKLDPLDAARLLQMAQASEPPWRLPRLTREARALQRTRQLGVLAASGPRVLVSERAHVAVQDCAALLATLPPRSVDAIITDPPYEEGALPAYADLAEGAAQVLKPSGVLLVMTGQYHLPAVIAALQPHLTYHWTLAYLTPGGQAPQIWPRHVNTFWKPILWWVRGEYDDALPWVGDVVQSDVNDNDKRFHDWGQSESGMARLVELFTAPDALIVDPFLGGGTTGVVAVRLGRRFLGGDPDTVSVQTAERRIQEALAYVHV